MKIGFIQFKPEFGDKEYNINKTLKLINDGKEADLLVLPELCNTGYLFENLTELDELAEEIPNGKTTQAWIQKAKETKTYIVAGICERLQNNFYNSSVLIGPKGFVDVYRKIHLFDNEKKFFKLGMGPLKVYDIGKAIIGMMICFDWAFPETARILALKGAEIICHPSNLVLTYAQKSMLSRSIENRIFTITANRIGADIRLNSKLSFTGNSQITSPKMEILTQAQDDTEEVVVIEIDPKIAQNKMITPNNHVFKDRRIDLYQSLLE